MVLRKVFHTGLAAFGWNVLATNSKLFLVYIILGAAYTLRTNAFINVDIFHRRFSPRVRAFVDLATSTLFFLFGIALLWWAVIMAAWDLSMLHPSLRLFYPPSWPVRLIIPVGVFLLLLQGLAKFVRDLIIATTGKEAI